MTAWRGNAERAALALCVALSLAACAETPRTELSWDVREHKTANNTFYGPRSVTLPPVEQQRVAPPCGRSRSRNRRRIRGRRRRSRARRPAGTRRRLRNQVHRSAHTRVRPRYSRSRSHRTPAACASAGRSRATSCSTIGATATGERNDGINIAAAQGTPVRAAASGTVSYCGNELRGYGNLVLIKHDNGYITAYAHVDSFVVGRSDRVVAGQVIAAGASGDVTSPQLHFEIRRSKQRPSIRRRCCPNRWWWRRTSRNHPDIRTSAGWFRAL